MTDLLMAVGDLTITDRFYATRSLTESLASHLSAEDQTVQSMADVSPTKWHRAHTTWFFETFLLEPSLGEYRPFHPDFGYLFNSYYEGVGARYPRNDRGVLSRPGIETIAEYRSHVDQAMAQLFEDMLLESGLSGSPSSRSLAGLVELGIQHEQQHQELLLMDIKHVLSRNPMLPAYDAVRLPEPTTAVQSTWTEYPEGTYEIGHAGAGFSFDNELPRHRSYLGDFTLADQLVTCGEWSAFIDDGGYRRPELWLSDGWTTVQSQGWESPLYWHQVDDAWQEFTLGGATPLNPAQPVCHVSYYEADAFARWAGRRLPTEAEWEVASADKSVSGHFLDQTKLHPTPVDTAPVDTAPVDTAPVDTAPDTAGPFGNVWQWTSSAYSPYPGFEAAPGAVGEYNGKFMVNQYVLRGGSCVTPPDHTRASYRNFFPPSARWAFTGLRLARNC